MKPVVKWLLIGCAVLVVLGVAAIVAITIFLRSKGTDLVAQGKAVKAEGIEAGRGMSEPECVAEAVARYRRDAGIVNGIKQRLWLSGCLETSTLDRSFCEGVPDDAITRSVTWRTTRCEELGLSGDPSCPNIMAEVQTYCASERRREK